MNEFENKVSDEDKIRSECVDPAKIIDKINEMDAADVVTAAQEADRKRVVPVEHPHAEDQTEGHTEEWSGRIEIEVGSEVRRWVRRQKRDACKLALLSLLTVAGCAVAWMTGIWKPIVAGITVVNLMMTGAWWHKAKAGWSV